VYIITINYRYIYHFTGSLYIPCIMQNTYVQLPINKQQLVIVVVNFFVM